MSTRGSAWSLIRLEYELKTALQPRELRLGVATVHDTVHEPVHRPVSIPAAARARAVGAYMSALRQYG